MLFASSSMSLSVTGSIIFIVGHRASPFVVFKIFKQHGIKPKPTKWIAALLPDRMVRMQLWKLQVLFLTTFNRAASGLSTSPCPVHCVCIVSGNLELCHSRLL